MIITSIIITINIPVITITSITSITNITSITSITSITITTQELTQNFTEFLDKKTEFLHGDLDQAGLR